jgi:hypothetical protein
VPAQQLAHARRRDRAAPEREHARRRALEQLRDHALLVLAERALAVALEDLLDRDAQAHLELVVGVDRARAERRGGGARRGRLAGAHEADEHQRARRGA